IIYQPASSFYGAQTGEFILETKELLKLLRKPHTGLCIKKWQAPMGCI
ncbi:hypothetical protein Gotur_014062, partial [Gossypium turneri]